jgi:ribonuclease P protein component
VRLDVLRRRSDFLRVQGTGRRFRSRLCAVLVSTGEAQARRVGFTVSRKVGKAVVRNRVRRRLREVVRNESDKFLPGYDHVIIAYPAAADASFNDLAKDLTWLLSSAHDWASQRVSS